MTINDLFYNMTIQGEIKITRWINDDEEILYHGNAEELNSTYQFMDNEIQYMYAIDGVGLVIELEER